MSNLAIFARWLVEILELFHHLAFPRLGFYFAECVQSFCNNFSEYLREFVVAYDPFLVLIAFRTMTVLSFCGGTADRGTIGFSASIVTIVLVSGSMISE